MLKEGSLKINYNLVADLKNTTLDLGHFIRKKTGVNLRIEASGKRDNEKILVDDAYVVLDQSRLSWNGVIRDVLETNLQVNLPPNGVPTSTLVNFVDPSLELQPGGRIEGDLVVKGNPFSDFTFESNFLFESHLSKAPRYA